MFNKSNEFTRRILNFPAIRPCESVSVPTLLSSLIDLGHRICSFKSRFFFTNKKNARNSINLIETLLLFLEESRFGILGFEAATASISLSLSELYFIFQKILFLLEDCSRDDSRMWMLMKSEKVSNLFRLLIRGVAVALEVVPLAELGVPDEAMDLVEFVRKHALKAKFEMEKDDRRAMIRVLKIVNQLQGGIGPESNDLKQVLDHLGIRTWSECNKEVKFLEGEIGEDCSSNDSREFRSLSNLLSFMIYCRCTLFPNVDTETVSGGARGNVTTIPCLNPEDFRCPITLEIMVDPVTISTGHTYDRASILKWFNSGNHTCPKTGERLISIDLVPNRALRRLINQYQIKNGFREPESGAQKRRLSPDLGSVAAEQTMALLANFLVCKLVAGTPQEQTKAAYEIRLLTKTNIFNNRSCFVENGVILPLLNLLLLSHPGVQENAMAAVLNLSKYHKSKMEIVENGGLEMIVNVLTSGVKTEARQHAAGALFYLASFQEYQRTVGRIPGTIPGLMKLLEYGTDVGKKNALAAILSLVMYPENHWRFLSAGLVLLLITVLKTSEREDLMTHSLAILATLAEKIDGAMVVISGGTLPVVVEILISSNSRCVKEYGVSLLLALCINDGADVVPILVKNPSLIVSLYSLMTNGTSRSSKKASSLIRILHAFNEKVSTGSTLSSQDHHQFVHVW